MKKTKINKIKTTIYTTLTILVIGVLSFVGVYFGYTEEVKNALITLFGLFSAFGIFAFLEIDDWFIWYKRLVIKKYKDKKGILSIKIYDHDLKKHYVEVPVQVVGYDISDKGKLSFIAVAIGKSGLNSFAKFNFTGNLIINSINIVDTYGNDIDVKKFSLLGDNSIIKNNYFLFKSLVKSYTGLDEDTKISINLNMVSFIEKTK